MTASARSLEPGKFDMARKRAEQNLAALGEVMVLLADVQGLTAGFYMVEDMQDGWTVLRPVIDNEAAGKLILQDQRIRMPNKALDLFMPVGINLIVPS
jgi:hypothetical protein